MKATISAVLFVALATSTRAAGLESYALETEARREPVGIDSPAPRLSWKLRSSERAQRQTAYQILVSTDPAKLVSGQADAWDSGRVASDETTWIPYAGKQLRSFTKYVWKVRVWDAAGQSSEWSNPASWTTAVVDRKDWREMWLSSQIHKYADVLRVDFWPQGVYPPDGWSGVCQGRVRSPSC